MRAKRSKLAKPPRGNKPAKEPSPIDWTYIFDKNLKKCYGRVEDRDMWGLARFIHDSIRDAARDIGITGVPKDAVAIRGVSPDDARDRHVRWLEKKRLEALGLFVPYHKRRKMKREAEARKKAAETRKKPARRK